MKKNATIKRITHTRKVINNKLVTTVLLDKDLPLAMRRTLARHPRTSAEVLAALATDEDADVRWVVALRSSTPAELLNDLASDKNKYVRRAVALNLSTPAELLNKLASDKDVDVLLGVALNPRTSAEVLAVLATDEDAGVRWGVAKNPSAPAEALNMLAADKDADVRLAAFEHKSFPKQLPTNKDLAKALRLLADMTERFVDAMSDSYDYGGGNTWISRDDSGQKYVHAARAFLAKHEIKKP